MEDPKRPEHRSYVAWSEQEYFAGRAPATALAVVNNFVRDWGHVFIHDRESLTGLLRENGFINVTEQSVGHSDDPLFNDVDNAQRMPAGFLALESMVYEADKPGELSPGK